MAKASVTLLRPSLRFPEGGWRDRLEAHLARVEAMGVRLDVRLGARGQASAAARAEAALGTPLPAALRDFLLEVDGARFDFVTFASLDRLVETTANMRSWQAEEQILYDVPLDGVVGFAVDGAENYYGHRVDAVAGLHRVIYFCHDPPGWEHRFSSLGAFIESALVRAHATALWRQHEESAGEPVDPSPWTAAALALEAKLDPTLLRTRED